MYKERGQDLSGSAIVYVHRLCSVDQFKLQVQDNNSHKIALGKLMRHSLCVTNRNACRCSQNVKLENNWIKESDKKKEEKRQGKKQLKTKKENIEHCRY